MGAAPETCRVTLQKSAQCCIKLVFHLTELLILSGKQFWDLLMEFNLYAPCILYVGQTYRYSTEFTFYIFSQQRYLIIFLDFLSPSSFFPPQNVLYFLMLHFLVHKIFTFK